MANVRFPVTVLMRRAVLANRWVSERWEPVAVEVSTEERVPRAHLEASSCEGDVWRFDGLTLELHRSEAEGYHLNLTSAAPKAFVMWRHGEPDRSPGEPGAFPVIVTASYNEAARMLDGGEQVDPVPLPPPVHEVLIPFTATHYKPEPRRKVRRNDPLATEGGAGPDRK